MAGSLQDPSNRAIEAVISIALIAVPIMLIAVGIKRLHDRGKSGWWLVLFYLVPGPLKSIGEPRGFLAAVSFGISLWALVELGFRRGTLGPNQYGPDPLSRLEAWLDAAQKARDRAA
jgi:uncharacterized membrane protein YhaH (DUF805 family)